MTKKDLKNLQDSLYNTILPPPESLKPAHDEGFHLIANIKNSFLNENNINCHPEERSELRILPVIDDSQERWSDSEHTCLVNDSTAERFRMTNKLPRPLGEGWGEGWQNNSNSTTKTDVRGEATEFILIILPHPSPRMENIYT